jgi:hypothetical protein
LSELADVQIRRFGSATCERAIKAGLPPDRLRVIHDKKNDKLIVEVVAEKASTATDLDDWLAKHADSTQGH